RYSSYCSAPVICPLQTKLKLVNSVTKKNKNVFLKRILDFIALNLSYFIAKRLATSKKYKNSVSAPIIKIAIAAVAISVVMMLVSVATGMGLQQKIRDKITSFNGHVVISNFDNNQSEITLEPI